MDIITGLVTPFTATGTRDGPADLPSLWAAHTAAQRCADGDINPLASDEVKRALLFQALSADKVP